jgi:hypothetical protein
MLTDDLNKNVHICDPPSIHKHKSHTVFPPLLPSPIHDPNNRNVKNMLGSAIERKPKVEQVNVTGGRLLREAKVC